MVICAARANPKDGKRSINVGKLSGARGIWEIYDGSARNDFTLNLPEGNKVWGGWDELTPFADKELLFTSAAPAIDRFCLGPAVSIPHTG